MHVITSCRAIRDYERKDPSELSLKVGDVVEVLKKGKYIWYGRLDDAKGFFPSRVVEVEEQSSNEEIGKPLSATAIVDNEKNSVVNSVVESQIPMESSKSDEPFKEIALTKPLEDKRRTKPKSPGRPPSQVFIKENILHKTESMEELNTTSDEENIGEDTSTTFTNIPGVSQLVMELKHKQKDTTDGTTITTIEHVIDGLAWKLPLAKKKKSVPEPPKKPDIVAPWMEEIRKRRQHKLSIKSDDEVQQTVSREFRISQENKVNHTSVETKSFGKTRTTNHAVSEETRNIQTKSISLETYEKTSNSNITATEINVNRISAGNTFDKNIIPLVDDVVTDTTKKSDSLIETSTIPEINAKVLVTEGISSTSDTSTYSCSIVQSKSIKDAIGNSKKIELPNETQVTVTVSATSNRTVPSGCKQTSEFVTKTQIEQPKSSVVHSTDNQEILTDDNKNTKNQNDISKDKPPSISIPQPNNHEKIVCSIQSVLKLVDSFEEQYKIRSLEILHDIKKLATSCDLQNQETKTFIEALKVQLSALIEDKL